MNAVIDLKTQPVKVAAPGKQLAAGEVKAILTEDGSFAAVLMQALTGQIHQDLTLAQPEQATPEASEESELLPVQPEETAFETGMMAQIWALLTRPAALGQETPETVKGQTGKETLPASGLTEKAGLPTQETTASRDSLDRLTAEEILPSPAGLDVEPENVPDPFPDLEPSALAGDLHQEFISAAGKGSAHSDQADVERDMDRDRIMTEHKTIERTEPQPAWTPDWHAREMDVPERIPSDIHASQGISRPGLDWEHLVAAITLDKQPDGQRLTVRLRPDEMGQLEILFEQTDQGLSARIVADNPETSQWLGSQVQNLQASLAEKGIACTSIDVVYTQSAFSQDSPFQKQQGQASPEDLGSRQRRGQGGHSIPNQNESGGQATSPPVRHPISSYIDRWT